MIIKGKVGNAEAEIVEIGEITVCSSVCPSKIKQGCWTDITHICTISGVLKVKDGKILRSDYCKEKFINEVKCEWCRKTSWNAMWGKFWFFM